MQLKRSLQKVAALFLFVCFVAAFPLAAAAREGVPAEVLAARDGVVRIINLLNPSTGEGAIGTGWAISSNGSEHYFVTNYHVVQNHVELYVTPQTGKNLTATVVLESIAHDIVVLRVNERIADLKVMPLEVGPINVGDPVYALGYPGAADDMNGRDTIETSKDMMTVTDGIISSIRNSNLFGNQSLTLKAIQHNASISGGNSGGPLLNSSGYVIGVNTFIAVADPKIGVSLHMEELVALLSSNNIQYTTSEDVALAESSTAPPVSSSSPVETPMAVTDFWWIGLVAVLVIIILIMAASSRKNKKKRQAAAPPQGMPPQGAPQPGMPMYGRPAPGMPPQGQPISGMPSRPGMSTQGQLVSGMQPPRPGGMPPQNQPMQPPRPAAPYGAPPQAPGGMAPRPAATPAPQQPPPYGAPPQVPSAPQQSTPPAATPPAAPAPQQNTPPQPPTAPPTRP